MGSRQSAGLGWLSSKPTHQPIQAQFSVVVAKLSALIVNAANCLDLSTPPSHSA